MQIPILTGIAGRSTPDLYRSHPLNLMPVVEAGDANGTGISRGYLRTPPGVRQKAATAGADRGGVEWNGRHFRATADTLYEIAVDGTQIAIGAIENDGAPVAFAQSFDRLAIASSRKLFYFDGAVLTEVTDPDLGAVISLAWQDGYFITTDGTSIVVTELADPTSVDPLKYGSSEADPDPVVGVLSQRSRLVAINRYSIEFFTNAGTTGFPFQVSRGSQIPRGAVGPHAFAPFVETFAFAGSGRNEAPAIYLAGAGQGIKISPRALDAKLATLSAADLALIELEARNIGGQVELLVHLPDETWVYGWSSSQQLDLPVWYRLSGFPRHATLVDGDWWVGSDGKLGVLDDGIAAVFGEVPEFVFDTPILYNEGRGAIVHDLELVTLGGRGLPGIKPWISLSYSDDGITFSEERVRETGESGQRGVRPVWRRNGRIRHWRSFRFRGKADAPVAFARLEARVEALT